MKKENDPIIEDENLLKVKELLNEDYKNESENEVNEELPEIIENEEF